MSGRPPTTSPDGEAPAPWRVWVGFGVVLALTAVLVVISGRSSGQVVPVTTTVATIRTAGDPGVGASAAHDAVVAAVGASLDVWARFATTGDPEVLTDTFVVDGPQHRQLQDEAGWVGRGSSPPGDYAFELGAPQVIDLAEDTALVRATVKFVPPQGDAYEYEWDIEMRRSGQGDRWRLWTVSTAQ